MRAVVRLAMMISLLITSLGLAVGAEPLTKRDTQGPVTVSATILVPVAAGAPVRLKIVLDTYSVALDDLELEDAVALRAADGTDLRPAAVDATGSGHHRQAIVTFPPMGDATRVVSTRGEVVGINSAIFSKSGGSVGNGFAIPINLARELVPQLKSNGRVTRGWLGVVAIAPVSAELSGKLGRGREGAVVTQVVPNGPATRAGGRASDVIVALEGTAVRCAGEFPRLTARASAGSEVELAVVRDGREQTVKVRLGELPERSSR